MPVAFTVTVPGPVPDPVVLLTVQGPGVDRRPGGVSIGIGQHQRAGASLDESAKPTEALRTADFTVDGDGGSSHRQRAVTESEKERIRSIEGKIVRPAESHVVVDNHSVVNRAVGPGSGNRAAVYYQCANADRARGHRSIRADSQRAGRQNRTAGVSAARVRHLNGASANLFDGGHGRVAAANGDEALKINSAGAGRRELHQLGDAARR